ncbi:YggS family pyridoxal phosphate-dependent enzyme [Clostridiaceae bacterium]|nr:YggS family pyridoxal phosphate-dependent enzyme [Clostridiaceae bacterium]RKI13112.1 YggS family pyridoxal phosphate-dependent enzyme [bacterium 1XD21-70]
MKETILANLEQVHTNIRSACDRSGRDAKEVTLIAVSKTKPLQALQAAYDCGERHFGENKVQEILQKAPMLPDDLHFHMIGHLQRNKVRQVLPYVTMIHSVDSLRLASEIQKEAERIDKVIDILLEVNVAKEESKFGFTADEVLDAISQICRFPNIKVCGLMTIAPFVENSEQNRPVFQKLFQLYVDIKHKNIDNTNMSVLSMGMTGDYQVAIEEGATMIRVGTGIFGVR